MFNLIDPSNITNYNLTDDELENHILFWVCAAGKNGKTAAKCLDKLLRNLKARWSCGNKMSPFQLIKYIDDQELTTQMCSAGIGCYTIKAKTFRQLAYDKLNLRTCSHDDLEKIYGIDCKTSRYFIIHSRPNVQLAGLDRHILRWLGNKGYKNIPTSTPTKKQYKVIEQIFLAEVKKSGKSVAELDLEIWNEYRNK
jgi:hypothetical protein